MVFIDAPIGHIEESSRPFFYQAQRDLTLRAYLVPFEAAIELSQSTAGHPIADINLKHTLFVQSTGRCGSTLLSKVLHELSHVHSLSEPDIYSSVEVEYLLHPDKLSRDEAVALTRAASVFLVRSYRTALPFEGILAIKARSIVINIADIIGDALPETKVRSFPTVTYCCC